MKEKKAMPFVQGLKSRLQNGEPVDDVLDRKLPFDERQTLLNMIPGMKRTANLKEIDIICVKEGGKKGRNIISNTDVEVSAVMAGSAVPGIPTYFFENINA